MSPHFTLEELCWSDTGVRHGVDNTPDASSLLAMESVLAPGLEDIRELLGHPLHINSGYRSPALNHLVGGS